MNLDFKNFKKISEDQHSAVMKHPQGHEIRLSKKSMNSRQLSDLGALPIHMDDGGNVPDSKPSETADAQVPNPNQPTVIINNGQPQAPQNPVQDFGSLADERGLSKSPMMNGASGSWDMPNSGAAPSLTPPMNPTLPKPPQMQADPYGTEAYNSAYTSGLNQQIGGINQEAQATGQLGETKSKLLENSAVNQQQEMKSFQEHWNGIQSEYNNFLSDYKNQHIDPNRIFKTMGMGQKISTSIGLILGGFAGGGQGNIVLDNLNKMIDRDVRAQEADLGKSKTLLDATTQQFGNLKDGTSMLRAMQMGVVANQVEAAGAKAMSPLARAKANQLSGELNKQAAAIKSQIAMKRTLLGGMQAGRVDPSQVIRMIVPEPLQQSAYKELNEAEGMIRAKDNILSSYDKLVKLNTLANRAGSPIQTARQVNAIRDPLIAGLSKETAGRFTDTDAKFIGTMFDTLGGNEQTDASNRNQLEKLINEKMNFNILKSYGINLGNASTTGKYGSDGQKTIKLGAPVMKSQEASVK